MKRLICCMLAMVSTPTFAKPVYLDCTLETGPLAGKPINVSADEAQGQVTWHAKGGTYTSKGTFEINSIYWTDIDVLSQAEREVSFGRLLGGYNINRTTLKFNYRGFLPDGSDNSTAREGKCRVVKPPKRAI